MVIDELQTAQSELEGAHSALGIERRAKTQAEIKRDALVRELTDERAIGRAAILSRSGRRGKLAKGSVLAVGFLSFLALLVFSWPRVASGGVSWAARAAAAVALIIQMVGAVDWSLRDLASKAQTWAEDTVDGRRELRYLTEDPA